MTLIKLNENIRNSLFDSFCKANAKFIFDNGLKSDFNICSEQRICIYGDEKIPILKSVDNITSPKTNEWKKIRYKVLLTHFNQYLKRVKKYDSYRSFYRDAVRQKRTTIFFDPLYPYLDEFCPCDTFTYIMVWKHMIWNFVFTAKIYYSRIRETLWTLEKEKYYDYTKIK